MQKVQTWSCTKNLLGGPAISLRFRASSELSSPCAVFLNDRLAAVNNSGNHPVCCCSSGIWIYFFLQSSGFSCLLNISKLSQDPSAGFAIIPISSLAPVHLLYPSGSRAKQNVSLPPGQNVTAFPFAAFPDHPGLLFLARYGLFFSTEGRCERAGRMPSTASVRAGCLRSAAAGLSRPTAARARQDSTAAVFYAQITSGLQQETAINCFWSHRSIFQMKPLPGVVAR